MASCTLLRVRREFLKKLCNEIGERNSQLKPNQNELGFGADESALEEMQ